MRRRLYFLAFIAGATLVVGCADDDSSAGPEPDATTVADTDTPAGDTDGATTDATAPGDTGANEDTESDGVAADGEASDAAPDATDAVLLDGTDDTNAPDSNDPDSSDSDSAEDPDTTPEPEPGCPATGAGLDCLFELHAEAVATCNPEVLDELALSFDRWHGRLPAWHDGEALFVSRNQALSAAGEWNGWTPGTTVTQKLCDTEFFTALATVPSGRHRYEMVLGEGDGAEWLLDPENWAFAWDNTSPFNPKGRNSILNTYDSGLGHLERPDEVLCSDALNNCRPYTTYVPPGYDAPENAERDYPVLFMHDGQNLWDDKNCCFGHTGWEINVQLDEDIPAGLVEPVVVVGFDHGGTQRADEYANPVAHGGLQEHFLEFQVTAVQPTAATYWRLDAEQTYVAGSSFGGLVSLRLAWEYPEVYRGAASLSGAFWPWLDSPPNLFSAVDSGGKIPVAIYQDYGGSEVSGSDGYWDNQTMRQKLKDLGWTEQTAPNCTSAPDALCHFHELGGEHSELAWLERTHLFLRFFFGTE